MKTRKEYMDNKISYEAYYGQFATAEVQEWVSRNIGIDRIKASKDEHLNDIPLGQWDGFASSYVFRHQIVPMLRESGDVNPNSLGNAVCVAKTAARILTQESQAA